MRLKLAKILAWLLVRVARNWREALKLVSQAQTRLEVESVKKTLR